MERRVVTAFAFLEKKKTETNFSKENSKIAIRFLRAGWIELGLEQQIEAYKKLYKKLGSAA